MSELPGTIFQNDTLRPAHLPGRVLRALSACLVLALVGCGESSVGPTQASPTLELPDISAAIIDAAHAPGEADGFYFLPPMVPQPAFDGSFDPIASPEVEICRVSPEECAPLAPPAIYTMTTGQGSETIRVDLKEQHYIVNWHTSGLDEGDYRISVSLRGDELGSADVKLVERGRDLRDVAADVVGIKLGRTLPIKFRIEVADAPVCTATTGAFDDLDGEIVNGVRINLDDTMGQIGFDGWEYGSSTDWQMESDAAVAQLTTVVFARTSSPIALFGDDCAFTIYADHFRGGVANETWAGGHGWFADGAGDPSSATTTGVIVVFRAKGFTEADIFLERYDDDGTLVVLRDDSGELVEPITIATVPFPVSTTQRLGADVSADGVTVVVWTKPVYPVLGSRTTHGTFALSSDIRDDAHRRGSLVAGAGGTPSRNFTANFTVEPLPPE